MTGRPVTDRWLDAGPARLPYQWFADVLVVFEGPRRLLWSHRGPGWWRPERLWPSGDESGWLSDHIGRGRPLLVVVEQAPSAVPMLPEELDRAPASVRALVELPEDGLPQLAIPAFDWLPRPPREHGLGFTRRGRDMIQADPILRLSSFVTDERRDEAGNVRFALPTGPCGMTDVKIEALIRLVFAPDARGFGGELAARCVA